MRGDWEAADLTLIEEKIATSPAGMAWRALVRLVLAAMGRPDEAREQLAILAADDFAALPFDANWPSALGEGPRHARFSMTPIWPGPSTTAFSRTPSAG
jgi:hypothetical protein